jgi:CheY-like chemotaxis protein
MPVKKLLLADDDVDDVFFISELIKHHPGLSLLSTAENGAEVISYLQTVIQGKSALPDVILLDQNMPRMNGLQTLNYLKSSQNYAHIPVVIYSTYMSLQLIAECTASGALLVAPKPESLDGYKKLMDHLDTVIETKDVT